MTNFITVTNYVLASITNPVPVVFAGLDYDSALAIYLNAFAAGAPWAAAVFACFMIWKSFKHTHFPTSDE